MWSSEGAKVIFEALACTACVFVFFGGLGLFLARLKPEKKEPPSDEA